MEDFRQQILDALIQETRRRLFKESFPRLRQCLECLSYENIWYRPNDSSNSVGNLTLHLCGNARQWILNGLGKQKDNRKRQEEFDQSTGKSASQLLSMLDELEKEIMQCLNNIGPEVLLKVHKVQTFEESGLSILIHVIEHFSYHVGQITYIVKMLNNQATNYYKDIPLE